MKFLLSRNRRNHGEVGSHSSLLGNLEELDEDEEIYGDDNKPSFDLSIYKKDNLDRDAPDLEPASPASTCSTKTKSKSTASSTGKPMDCQKKTNDNDNNTKDNKKKDGTKWSNSSRSPDQNQNTNELIANTIYNNHNRGESEGDDLSYDVLPLSLWSKLKQDQDISPSASPQKSADNLLEDPQEAITTNTENHTTNNNHRMDTTAGDFTFPTNFADTENSNFVFDGEITDRIVISEIPQPSSPDYESNVVEGLITDTNGDSWIVFIPRPIDFNDELTWFTELSEYQTQPLNKTLSSLTSDSQESHRRRQRHAERERLRNSTANDNNTPQWTASAVLDVLRDTICSYQVRHNINELLKK